MSEILCQWLNKELKVSRTVSPKSFAKAFSSGYLLGEVLHKFELQDDFSEFLDSRVSSAKLNNFSRLEPTLNLLGVQFDQNVAHGIITEKPGVATKLLYQLYIALQKKKKSGLTGVEMQTMQRLTNLRLQNMKSDTFQERLRHMIPRQTDFNLMRITYRFQEKYKHVKEDLAHLHFEKLERFQKLKEEQRCFDIEKQYLNRRRQNEIMAKIQAAIIQIPKPASNRTLKALEAQKMMKKKKEAEDVADEIKKFEALIKKDLQAKESASKTSLDTAGQTTTDLLNTYSDDEYIKKIQKRLEEDAFAREQREKRRRKLLMDQLIAHEAQEEAYREEQLINRLMRQSQQERRIAVQLMHVRHEKEVLWQNRIFREKQHEERRLKDFQDALDREAALAKQAKIDFEEQFLKEKRFHDQIAVERAQARYEKHYSVCAEILDQIVDLSTKVADYRMLTNNLIPYKLMHDWKELFFNAKPIYEQASVKTLPANPSREQLTELEKRDLLDTNDYEEYKNMVGEWALPEEMVDNLPPSNNCILGHILHRLAEKSLPPRAESTTPELPSFAVKGCLLGKTLSGKTTILRSLQKDFPIQILSIDTLVQEAIQAFHDNEKVSEVLPIQKNDEEDALPVLQEEIKESQDPQHVFSAGPVSDEVLPETEGETMLSANADKTPKAEEVKSSDSFLKLTTRAQLGAKSEQLLKKGKSIPDVLLVDIIVNAINEIPVNQDCILDGFPMTLNQAQLLEEALTGCNRNLTEVERKKAQKSTLAIDPATSKEIPLPSPAFDFVILLDVSDTSSMSRMNDIIAEELSYKTAHEDISQRVAAENQDKDGDQNLRDQIQHRIIGFLDNWPLLEQWFSEPENILIKINAEIDKESLCEKVKEILTTEIAKKKNKVEKKLEEKEAEKKAAASLAELPLPTPPPAPPPEPEKEKEIHQSHVASKTPTAKGKPQSGSPKGKSSGGKVPVKKSPADSTDTSPVAIVPQPPKPGSEEWVYVNEPVPEEMPLFLVPYWELIENSYINTIKTVLRHLREDQHTVLAYLYEIRTSFQEFLKRPDHKQDFVAQWQADFNSLPDDLWDDEETKAELHQRVNDLRDRLWDICDARKEEAEQERLDIINESWLQDTLGMTMNHFFSLMQAELNRFQDTKRLLQDYYWGMESKIPVEDNKRFTRIPLVQLDSKDNSESQLRIPLVPRISISLETVTPKPKTKSVLKGKMDNSLENVESNFEADEKLVMDTWQQASLAVSHMVAAEIHQRLMEEEKENQPADPKEKSPQMGANKKVKKEPPKKKQEDKKPKGKSPPMAEATPVIVTTEEIAEIKRKNELRVKIKEEHLAALQFEEIATQFRLELIKTKALALLEDLVTKVVDVYKLMEKWLGERYLNEMASTEKLTDVARYHIETSTKIQNELYLSQEDFFINGNIKVFPDPPPSIRPPPVEKEEDGTLTIEQLDSLRDQFLDMAPKGDRKWLHGLQAALQNFLKGYPAIVRQLHSAGRGKSDTSQKKPKELLESLLQADIVKFAHFLLDVMNVLSILSCVNKNRNSSIADIFATLESMLEMLQMYQTRLGPKERMVDSATHFHGNCLRGKENISAVRNIVLTHLIKRLQGCFRDASQNVVRATVIGSFKLWPTKINQEFGEKEVSILTAHYEPVLEAANVKLSEVDTEWSMLKLEIYARFQNIRKLTWDFVNSIYLHKYPNILTLVDLVLTLPASSAEAEHGFSQMKWTKSHMHAKIKAESIIGNKAFTDILIDLVTLNLGTNNFPSNWMHLTQPELQELTSLLTVNSEFVDWRKFLLVTSMPWPIPLEEELLETLQKFKAVDKEQLGTITFEQYMQAGLWFTGDEDIKIPENPLEPLPFNRQEHLIEFFFRLFADYEKDPPQLDYTQMLLYFACHPDTVEGVYRALSVAVGTHVFQQVKASIPSAEKTSSTDAGPAEEFPEPEENAAREERKLKDDTEKREQKDEEIPENANNEKMSMETLLKVFKGGSEAQDSNRFASHLKIENIYAEGFIKTFQDLGAKNLEPIEVAVLLKHPFIQDLISNYSDYKFPVHIIYVVEMIVCAKGWAPLPSGKQCARWRN
ncbi:sperm flagellar protein 2 isoform X5 [Homo sapiens]|uniref:sperm flagellar protein 2 isoform X5 n=1 Tax=Homo sapiens TaxID=9606 RepID=UPI0005D0265D|nr:sperm flagellar protein 2 isoform X5 [Homo sapiens]|eukprot:XP_011512441.1 sperm flagellar protein 2 isoform X5 [Homo sapiens]